MKVSDDRVVLVSADRDCAAVIARSLESLDGPRPSLDWAKHGAQGISTCLDAGRPRPYCAIVDFSLPDLDGVQVLKGLEDEAGSVSIPVLMLLDSPAAPGQAREALRNGAHEVMVRSGLSEETLPTALEAARERFEMSRERRRKGVAIERRAGQLKAIVDTVPDVIMRFDVSLNYSYINGSIERVTGLGPSHFLGKSCIEAGMPPDLSELWQARLDHTLRLREESVFEFPFDTPGGQRWFQARIVPEYGEDGGVESILGVATDITAARQSAEAVRRSERQLRDVLDCLSAFVGVLTPDGILIEANRPALEAASLRPEDVLGRPFDETYWWSYSADVRAGLREAIEKARRGDPSQYDVDVRVGEGRFITIDFTLVPLKDERGEITHLIPSAMDITDRRRTEEALRESERRFRSLATSDCIGIVVGDRHGGLSYVNDEYLRLLGYTRQEYDAHPFGWTEITPPEWLEVDRRMISEAWDGGASSPYEKEYIAKNGRRVPVLVGFARLSEHDEKLVAFVLDLTERKRAEKALRDADRRKNEFIAMLAHELRNPLAAISTAVHILKMKGPTQPELVWGRDVIGRQVKQLTRLIDDLLDVSRITTGKIQLKRSDIDIRDVINRASESVQQLIASREHELTLAIQDGPLPAFADPSRLEQVVTNLLTNAAKFTDCGGKLTVSAEHEGGSIIVRVLDNGVGIAPELKPVIFDLFTQIEPAPDRGHGGLGIGLTLVKSLVEMHGGAVEVRSEGAGQGSEFTVRIPSTETSRNETRTRDSNPSHDEVARSAGKRSRVLVVDDHQDVVHGLARLLETAGHEVRTAHEAASALQIARDFRPEFILTDIGLPGMDGYELARELRVLPQLAGATLIAVSGYGQVADKVRSRSAGFDHHLLKPVEPSTLLPLLVRPSRNRLGD